jgi:hypothetical protein
MGAVMVTPEVAVTKNSSTVVAFVEPARLGLAARADDRSRFGDQRELGCGTVGEALDVGDLMLRLALGLPDATAEGLEPVSALRLTAGRSTLQCMPAALAMRAAPAIQMPASAENAITPPSLLNALPPST